MATLKLITIVSLLLLVWCLSSTNAQPMSPNYKIPSYYGSREMDFLQRDLVLSSNLSSVYWKNNTDYDPDRDVYFIADSVRHFIMMQDSNGRFEQVAGMPLEEGYRDGDIDNSLFRSPTAVVHFKRNQRQAALKQKVIILKNTNPECLYATYENYTSCEAPLPAGFQNSSELKSTDEYKPDNVDMMTIKEIFYPDDPNKILPDATLQDDPVLIIADTGNHCIRKVFLVQRTVSTIAGECGSPGFKDGPPGINKLQDPTALAIDSQGVVFFFDRGNDYIRMVDIDGYVTTLVKGSCRQDLRKPIINYTPFFSLTPVMCYKSWKKDYGQPYDNIFIDTISSVCAQHQTICDENAKKEAS